MYLSPDLPDYVRWAEAMGCIGLRAEAPEDVRPVIDKANEIDDRPVVIDFRTDSQEKVYPMVPRGRRTPTSSSTRPRAKAAIDGRDSPDLVPLARPARSELGAQMEPGNAGN